MLNLTYIKRLNVNALFNIRNFCVLTKYSLTLPEKIVKMSALKEQLRIILKKYNSQLLFFCDRKVHFRKAEIYIPIIKFI